MVLAGLLLVSGVIGYFLYSLLRQFTLYRQLQEGLNQAKLEAIEQERRVLVADLHDDICPTLNAISFRLDSIEPVTDREKELKETALGHIDLVYNRVRLISGMMVPLTLKFGGPFSELYNFAATYLEGQPLKLQIGSMPRTNLSEFRSLHLFRILQEILQNTVKHARAGKLSVDPRFENGQLIIETRDDGIGFDPAAVKKRAGLGLNNIEVRARMIGAKTITESWPGKGTRYLIVVPLIGKSGSGQEEEFSETGY